jgi:hypothetical protein
VPVGYAVLIGLFFCSLAIIHLPIYLSISHNITFGTKLTGMIWHLLALQYILRQLVPCSPIPATIFFVHNNFNLLDQFPFDLFSVLPFVSGISFNENRAKILNAPICQINNSI